MSVDQIILPSKSTERRRLVLSLAQDTINPVSRGRKNTPKHVALLFAVKHMVGSTKLTTLLDLFWTQFMSQPNPINGNWDCRAGVMPTETKWRNFSHQVLLLFAGTTMT